MTIVTPNPAPVVPAISMGAVFPSHFKQYTDVTSFTYRTGMTHMALVEHLRHYVTDVLTPHIDENFEGITEAFDVQVNALVAAVDAYLDTQKTNVDDALTEQTAAYTAAIAEALTAISQADIQITDPAILAVLNTANSATRAYLDAHYGKTDDQGVLDILEAANSLTLAYLDTRYANEFDAKGAAQAVDDKLTATRVFYAADPSGGDDTAALTAAAHLAATTRGELILGYGQYNVSALVFDDQFIQPLIRGRGADHTIIAGIRATDGKSIVKFRGGSGALSGGGLRDLGIHGFDTNTNLAGVELSGCGHVILRNLHITGVDSAVIFHNEEGGDFTEFCEIQDSVVDNSHRFLLYKVDNGVESFHGSGARGANLVNLDPANGGPVVQTLSNALPYNAPLDFTWFPNNPNQYLFDYGNNTSGRHASYFGTIKMEGNAGWPANYSLGRGNQRVLFNGKISHFGTGSTTLGNIYLMNKITYEGGYVGGEYEPVSTRATLKNSPTLAITNILQGGETGLLTVHIVGPNFDKSFTFLAYQSPYNDTGTLIQLGNPSNIDNAGVGAPAFSWSGNGLYIADAQFTNQFTAHLKLIPLGGATSTANLAQYQAA